MIIVPVKYESDRGLKQWSHHAPGLFDMVLGRLCKDDDIGKLGKCKLPA